MGGSKCQCSLSPLFCFLVCFSVLKSLRPSLFLLRGPAYFFTFHHPLGIHPLSGVLFSWWLIFQGLQSKACLAGTPRGLQVRAAARPPLLASDPCPWMPLGPVCFSVKLPPPATPAGCFPFSSLASPWTKPLFLVPLILAEKG